MSDTGLKSSETFGQGDSVSDPEFREKLNELAAQGAAFKNLDTDMAYERGPGVAWLGSKPPPYPDQKITAKITDFDPSDPTILEWVQVWREDANTWVEQTDGVFDGTKSVFPMREINNNAVPIGTIVEAWVEIRRDNGEPQWVCEFNTGVKVVQVREDSITSARGKDFLVSASITYSIWDVDDDPDVDPAIETEVPTECLKQCDTFTIPAPDDSLAIAFDHPEDGWILLHTCERARRTCQTFGMKVREDSTVAARGEDDVTTASITYSIWRCEDDPAIDAPMATAVPLECNGHRDDLTEYVPAPDDSLALVVVEELRPVPNVCGLDTFILMSVCEKKKNKPTGAGPCVTQAVLVREDSTVAARGEDMVTTASITYSIWDCEDDPAVDTALDTLVPLECNGWRDDETEYVPAPDDSRGIAIFLGGEWVLLNVCEHVANPFICCDPECPEDCADCASTYTAEFSGAAEGDCCCDNINIFTGVLGIGLTPFAPDSCNYTGSDVETVCFSAVSISIDCVDAEWVATVTQDSDPSCMACGTCVFGATETATGSIPFQACDSGGPSGAYTMTWDGTGGNGCTGSFTMTVT